MAQGLTFGGYDLTGRFLVRVDMPAGPSARIDTVQVAGRDGDVVTGAALDAMTVTAHCTLRAATRPRWDEARREVAAALAPRGERALTLPGEDGLWRYATASPAGALSLPLEPPASFDVEFCCHDPVAYGELRTVAIPAGSSSVTFEVGGTAPASPTVACAMAGYEPSDDPEEEPDRLWTLAEPSGDHMSVTLPSIGTDARTRVSVDCGGRVALVNGVVSAITLDSDWLTLAPGAHTLSLMAGVADADVTISFYERWY